MIEVDEQLARRLVDRQFPHWAGLPIRPVELSGWDNRTFRLGDELSVRLPSGDGYRLQVEKEQRWLPVLAPRLPLPVPVPVALGEPGEGYPYAWSVYRWIDGTPAAIAPIADIVAFARDLGAFLVALGGWTRPAGPPPGEHNFFRGGPLASTTTRPQRRGRRLGGESRATPPAVWEDALAAAWTRSPVWFHGDVADGNLLVRDGRLAAVIDFGTSGVGDPACDPVIAWTLFDGPPARRSARRSAATPACGRAPAAGRCGRR